MAPIQLYVHKALDPLAVAELEETAMQQVQSPLRVTSSPHRNGTHFGHTNINGHQEPLLPGAAGNHSAVPIDHSQSKNAGKKIHGHWIVLMVLVWLLCAGIMTALYDHSKRKQQRRCRRHRERRRLGRRRSVDVKRRWEAIAIELDALAARMDDTTAAVSDSDVI